MGMNATTQDFSKNDVIQRRDLTCVLKLLAAATVSRRLGTKQYALPRLDVGGKRLGPVFQVKEGSDRLARVSSPLEFEHHAPVRVGDQPCRSIHEVAESGAVGARVRGRGTVAANPPARFLRATTSSVERRQRFPPRRGPELRLSNAMTVIPPPPVLHAH